jgi:hypothetical protein
LFFQLFKICRICQIFPFKFLFKSKKFFSAEPPRAQPDNRDGNEICLAVLNNFYADGIKWHDVACHHKKPTFCELPPPPRFFH